MDDIIQTVKLEVTLDCEEGTTLSKMWSYVELAQRRLLQRNGMDSESYTIDDALKRYLWQYILQLREMTFINEGLVIYDTASKGAAQSNEARDFLALSADEAESRFPNLIIRASCEAINKEIFGRVEGNEKLLRSVNSYKIIQALSRSREKGITQVQLSKMFELDPRSTFHFIKTIDREGLIVKFTTYDSGNTTNLWVLRRFITNRQGAMNKVPALGSGKGKEPAPIPSDDSPSLTAYLVGNDLRRRASDILEAAGSRFMPETDLMDALKLDLWNMRHRKYFHRVLRDLSENGFAEKAELQLPDADLSGFDPEVYKPIAEPMDVDEGHENAEPISNVPHDEEADAENPQFEKLESAPGKKTKDKGKGKRAAKQPAKPKKSRQESQADRSQRGRLNRGLADGHSYRRCVRFIKPYVDKGSVRTRLGVPLEQSADDLGDVPMIDLNAADNGGRDDSSSDDDELDVETLKEKDDILYVMNNHSVQVGALATLAPEAQVFRLIALSGSHGIVSRAIQFLLGWNALKPLYRCLTHLEQTPVFLPDGSWPGVYTSEECKRENREHMDERLIVSVEEFMGREHRKRFFVNPLARMAIESLTAYSGAVTAQQPTTLSQPALPAPSQAASDSPAAVTAVASGSRDGASVPPSGELAMPTEQPEARPQAPDTVSEPAVTVSLIPDSDPVLADMVQSLSLSDIYAESKERRVPLNAVIREYAVLGMLKQESVFACNTEQVTRCDQLVKSYASANMDSPVMTPTLSKTLLNYSMDKRTFQRIVMNLADQNRLWFQDIYSLPEVTRANASSKVQVAIARDTDPTGPIVHAYIAQLRDLRKLNKQTAVRVIRRIADPVPVVRTKGAEERDRDFLLRKMDTDESRAQGTKNFSMKHPIGRKYCDQTGFKRQRDSNGFAIVKRARVSLLEDTTKDVPLGDWDVVEKRLDHIPRRIGRAKNLYDYLANNLADNVDNNYAYENYAFRSSFLFYRLPLELFLQISGGISYFQELLPFIRNGSCTQVDGGTDGSAEVEVDDTPSTEASSLENINLRLATPVNMLPPAVCNMIEKKVVKARLHIQSLIYALYILQLLRPVDTAKDIVSMPPPPDAKDVFSSVPVTSPKILGFGYQLVGKARLLRKDGYDLALDAYNGMVKHRLDLTTCYLDDNVYNMLDKDGQFKYWSDLHATASIEAKHMTSKHLLYGIGLAYYWVLDVSLDGRQTKLLHSYVDEAEFTTPLDDPDLLTEAAKRAGTTLEEARRYYLHQHSNMVKQSARTKTYQDNRARYVKNRVEKAKVLETERRKAAEENGEVAGEAGNVKKSRLRWSDKDSTMVSVCYAVMKHHAKSHNHMFVLLNVGGFFPVRNQNMDPSDNARHHWQNMQHKATSRLRCDKICTLWKYVFRDAIERGDLEDSEDLNSFDTRKAVDYYCNLLRGDKLDDLLSHYADDLAKDNVVFETVEPSSSNPARPKITTKKPKPVVVDDEHDESDESDASDQSEAGAIIVHRLPATLQGKAASYKVKAASRTRAAGPRGFEFTEDVLRENLSVRHREQHAASVIVTTHRGWECATDHHNPSTISLSIRPNGLDANRMDVDGETPKPAWKDETVVVTQGTGYLSYKDTMGRRGHVKRKFDGNALVNRISELTLNDNIDPESDHTPKVDVGDHERPQLYAELAALQAMVVNLAITPADEYDVETGHKLLEAKRSAASEAYRLAKTNNSLVRLTSMAASSGLNMLPTATASGLPVEAAEAPSGSTEVKGGALTSLTNALKSATVAYETTGMMRITSKPGIARSSVNRTSASDANASTNEDADVADDKSVDVAMSLGNRKVPGRGHSVTNKFMSIIRPTHADRFANLHEIFGTNSLMLDGHLGQGAFEQLCWLVGRGKLWLRPEYNSDMLETLQSGMAGFKNQADLSEPPYFALKAVHVDDTAGTETRADQMDEAYRRSTSISAFRAPLPNDDSLAVASRVLTSVIHEMGAMGASEYELYALLAVLLGSNAYKKILAVLPSEVRLVLSTRSQFSALLRLLALEGKVRVVGSSDLRYVSNSVYGKYWSVTLDGIGHTFEPYLGQNMSGSVNTTYTLGMLTSLVSHIVDNPGIPQFMLVRRFFAPVIPKKEVLSYLGMLVAMGLVVAENINSDVLTVEGRDWSVAGSTHYFMAPDYRHQIAQLRFSWVASHLNKV